MLPRISLESVLIGGYLTLNMGVLISTIVVLSKASDESCDKPLRFYLYGQMGIAASNLVVAFGYEPRYGPSLKQLYSLIMACVYFAWNLLGGFWLLTSSDCVDAAPTMHKISIVWVIVSLIFLACCCVAVCWCCARGQPVSLESLGLGKDDEYSSEEDSDASDMSSNYSSDDDYDDFSDEEAGY